MRTSPGGWEDNPGQRRRTRAWCVNRSRHNHFPPKHKRYHRLQIKRRCRCRQLRGEGGYRCLRHSYPCGAPFLLSTTSPPTTPSTLYPPDTTLPHHLKIHTSPDPPSNPPSSSYFLLLLLITTVLLPLPPPRPNTAPPPNHHHLNTKMETRLLDIPWYTPSVPFHYYDYPNVIAVKQFF